MSLAEFEWKVAGIPCIVAITRFNRSQGWAGSPESCPSSEDYHGGCEVEFEILDRKGYKAKWLERKLSSQDTDEIEHKAMELL